jgi:drug/metabolite transporter (DMT)-like permease
LSRSRLAGVTLLALMAFAGNSLLCRIALKQTQIDPASFTAVRLIAGALVLGLVLRLRGSRVATAGSWNSSFALVIYAACFSFAYVSLPAGVGALLLFGAVQVTMIGYGLAKGERLRGWQGLGFGAALAGLVLLLRPGFGAPNLLGSGLMLVAGLAWGVYSLRGRSGGDPIDDTAGNFLRSVPLAVLIGVLAMPQARWDLAGCGYAVASGALASGCGYVIWYTALKGLRATEASAVQLSVPVITAFGGVVLLGEPILLQTVLASAAILGGIAMVLFVRPAVAGS